MSQSREDELLAKQLQAQFDEETKYKRIQERHSSVSTSTSSKPKSLVDPQLELSDPTPNIFKMFADYNSTYFNGRLSSVEVRWSPRMTLCAGLCYYQSRAGYCSIRLSEPLLRLRPRKDLVETLLHEMIHAYLFVTRNNRDHSDHGPEFHKHMYRINAAAGTNISVYHNFHDEVDNYRIHWWRCNGPCQNRRPFFGIVKRATNRAPGPHDLWHAEHQATCGGTFIKIKGPDLEDGGESKNKKGKKRPLSTTTENQAKPKRPSISSGSSSSQLNGTIQNYFGNNVKSPGTSASVSGKPQMKTIWDADKGSTNHLNTTNNKAPTAGGAVRPGIYSINDFASDDDDDDDEYPGSLCSGVADSKLRSFQDSYRSKTSSVPNMIPFSGKAYTIGSRTTPPSTHGSSSSSKSNTGVQPTLKDFLDNGGGTSKRKSLNSSRTSLGSPGSALNRRQSASLMQLCADIFSSDEDEVTYASPTMQRPKNIKASRNIPETSNCDRSSPIVLDSDDDADQKTQNGDAVVDYDEDTTESDDDTDLLSSIVSGARKVINGIGSVLIPNETSVTNVHMMDTDNDGVSERLNADNVSYHPEDYAAEKVECCLCLKLVLIKDLNTHLDMCETRNTNGQSQDNPPTASTATSNSSPMAISQTSSLNSNPVNSNHVDVSNEPEVVNCPVCDASVLASLINNHLDNCLG